MVVNMVVLGYENLLILKLLWLMIKYKKGFYGVFLNI